MKATTRKILSDQAERDERAKREQEEMVKRLIRKLGAFTLPPPKPLRFRPFEHLPEILMDKERDT